MAPLLERRRPESLNRRTTHRHRKMHHARIGPDGCRRARKNGHGFPNAATPNEIHHRLIQRANQRIRFGTLLRTTHRDDLPPLRLPSASGRSQGFDREPLFVVTRAGLNGKIGALTKQIPLRPLRGGQAKAGSRVRHFDAERASQIPNRRGFEPGRIIRNPVGQQGGAALHRMPDANRDTRQPRQQRRANAAVHQKASVELAAPHVASLLHHLPRPAPLLERNHPVSSERLGGKRRSEERNLPARGIQSVQEGGGHDRVAQVRLHGYEDAPRSLNFATGQNRKYGIVVRRNVAELCHSPRCTRSRGVTFHCSMHTFVGLDCGGSTSRVLAVDEMGKAVFRGQSGPANLLATPEEIVIRNLRKASEGCPPATSVCGAFAGLVGPSEKTRAENLLRELFPGAAVRAEADYAAAHAAAPAGTHVTIIAGTGSLVCGNDHDGHLVKTGGRGYLLGDEGSGYRFGHAALVHFLRRPGARTANLWGAVESIFGTREDSAIVSRVYQAPSPQPLLARLLPAFAADLDAGAAYAEAIAAREQTELAELVATHIETYLFELDKVRIALAGGVWNASEQFERLFRTSLQGWLPEVEIEVDRIVRPPVQGAVELAKEHRAP